MNIQLKLATSAGIEDLVKTFNLRVRMAESATYSVEYTDWKAAIVHEVNANHAPPTQWKYLEQPFRELRGDMVRIIADQISRGRSLRQAIQLAILRLFNASQRLVPVDTGDLKDSGRINYEGTGGFGSLGGGSGGGLGGGLRGGSGGGGFGRGLGGSRGGGFGFGGLGGGSVGLGGIASKIKRAIKEGQRE